MTGRKERYGPSITVGRPRGRLILVFVLFLLAAVSLSLDPNLFQVQQIAASSSFSFAAAGDWADSWGTSGETSKVVLAVAASGSDFAVALGDLAYTDSASNAQSWCGNFKSIYNNIVVVSGNHDSGESNYGPMDVYNQACPFSALGVSMIAGTIVDDHGTSYGYEYAFDYPASNPIARIILIVPSLDWSCCGLSGSYSYDAGTPNYAWVASRIDEAKALGEWVIVGWHKNGLSSTHGFDIGADIWNLMFEKRVDLVMSGHDHVYERAYQLSCGNNDVSCIANNSPDTYTRGAGVEYVIQGTGGQGLYSVAPDTVFVPAAQNDAEHGFIKYIVTSTTLSGQFVSVDGSFTDHFTISSSATSSPVVSFTFSPSSPVTGGAVTFTGSASGGSPPYSYSWSFGDGSTAAGQSVTHTYSSQGSYTAGLTVTDSNTRTGTVSRTVAVSAPATPDFSMVATPNALLVQAGSSDSSSIDLASLNGFSGTVTFSAAASPQGLSASLSPMSVSLASGGSGSSALTVGTTGSTQLGDYDVTVTGTSGSAQNAVHIQVTVSSSPPAGDFSMSATPQSLTLNAGASGRSIITVGSVNGYAGAISISTSADPELDLALSSNSVSLPSGASQTLTATVTVFDGVGPGSYSVSFDGTDGTLSHSVVISVEVIGQHANSPPVLSVPGPQSGTVGSAIEFFVKGSDPDPADRVTLSASGLPSAASFDTATGEFSWIPSANQVGSYTVTFTATDDGSPVLKDSGSVIMSVEAAPPPVQQPPSFNPTDCPWCQIVPIPATPTNLWMLTTGGLIGVTIATAGLYARARSRLNEARRLRRLNRRAYY